MGYKRTGIFILLFSVLTALQCLAGDIEVKQDLKTPFATDLSIETKRSIRKEMLSQLLVRYDQNQIFANMHEYMLAKYHQLKKSNVPRSPNVIIEDALEKSRNLFDKVKPFVKNDFKKKYQPEEIEKSVNKYLWLKGLCFLVMGIKEEHKIALSYFYVPGNEEEKKIFLRDTVKFSFPEVYDVPENSAWFDGMSQVMDRLGYKLFDVHKYCPEAMVPEKSTPMPTAEAEKPVETPQGIPEN